MGLNMVSRDIAAERKHAFSISGGGAIREAHILQRRFALGSSNRLL